MVRFLSLSWYTLTILVPFYEHNFNNSFLYFLPIVLWLKMMQLNWPLLSLFSHDPFFFFSVRPSPAFFFFFFFRNPYVFSQFRPLQPHKFSFLQGGETRVQLSFPHPACKLPRLPNLLWFLFPVWIYFSWFFKYTYWSLVWSYSSWYFKQ